MKLLEKGTWLGIFEAEHKTQGSLLKTVLNPTLDLLKISGGGEAVQPFGACRTRS